MTKVQDAPAELELVRAFVNTLDVEEERADLASAEQLTSPAALGEWLREHGLLEGGPKPTAADLRRALELRAALRALMFANNGEPLDPAAPAVLDAAARRAGVGLRFDAQGEAGVEPAAAGVDGALGRLLAIVAVAMADRTWERLKACASENCQWAFYDRSRNHSARWCKMEVCGNRTKARAYRARRRAVA